MSDTNDRDVIYKLTLPGCFFDDETHELYEEDDR